MLPKINRLTKEKDFEAVFKHGKSAKSGFLAVRVLKNNLPESRFGFVVSKKISTKATVRNKIKRRMRDAVVVQLKTISPPADVVVITMPSIVTKTFLEIKKAIEACLNSL